MEAQPGTFVIFQLITEAHLAKPSSISQLKRPASRDGPGRPNLLGHASNQELMRNEPVQSPSIKNRWDSDWNLVFFPALATSEHPFIKDCTAGTEKPSKFQDISAVWQKTNTFLQ